MRQVTTSMTMPLVDNQQDLATAAAVAGRAPVINAYFIMMRAGAVRVVGRAGRTMRGCPALVPQRWADLACTGAAMAISAIFRRVLPAVGPDVSGQGVLRRIPACCMR